MGWANSRGQKSGTQKLTEERAQAILDAPTLDDAKRLCEEYGVSTSNARCIRSKRSWAHLKRTRPIEA